MKTISNLSIILLLLLQAQNQLHLYKPFSVTSLQHHGIVSENKLDVNWTTGKWKLKKCVMK